MDGTCLCLFNSLDLHLCKKLKLTLNFFKVTLFDEFFFAIYEDIWDISEGNENFSCKSLINYEDHHSLLKLTIYLYKQTIMIFLNFDQNNLLLYTFRNDRNTKAVTFTSLFFWFFPFLFRSLLFFFLKCLL